MPPIAAFKAMQALMTDFSLQNIEVLTTLLENCGRYAQFLLHSTIRMVHGFDCCCRFRRRYLYLTAHTRERMEEMLATMMRLRRQKYLDVRQQAMGMFCGMFWK
jgi:hypothetical protein